MKDNKKVLIILICLLFLIIVCSIVGIFYVSRPSESQNVVIMSNNKVIYNLDLSKEKDRTFEVENNGKINTIEIKDNKIRVKEADCPDKVCVNSGWLDSEDLPIVCLPNKLIIKYAESSDGIDSVSK